MRINKRFIKLAVILLMTAFAFLACGSDGSFPDGIAGRFDEAVKDSIRFTAHFGVKNVNATRSLTDTGDGTLKVSWQVGEEVAIVYDGNKYVATVDAVDDKGNASVSALLPGDTPNNQAVTFVYPASAADGEGVRSGLLAEQDGLLETVSKSLDVATAEGHLVVSEEAAMPSGIVVLDNEYAICRFSFKDENGCGVTGITQLCIVNLATTSEIVVTPPNPMAELYVAMEPGSNTFRFRLKCRDVILLENVSNANLEKGLFYHPALLMIEKNIPLTLEAIDSGTISFQNSASGPVYYSINRGPLMEIVGGSKGTTPELSPGDKVAFYGDNLDYCAINNQSRFFCSADCYVYGNIMSLVSSKEYPELKVLTGNGFPGLFSYNTHIRSHPTKKLELPATALIGASYCEMFYGCTGLTTAPDLPATIIGRGCYSGMFYWCTGLRKPPAELPATELAPECYSWMFYWCTSLEEAPKLPAMEMTEYCYYAMFNGCSNLKSAPELPATDIATRSAYFCYGDMFYMCSSLESAPSELPAKSLVGGCYSNMFYVCTSLKTAPKLPAETLDVECYAGMFHGCSSLTSVPQLPATKLAEKCYESMFRECKSLSYVPDLPATKMERMCYAGMFQDCYSLISSPLLPATDLEDECYAFMFSGCTQLQNVRCYATSISTKDCVKGWLSGVSSSGTFVKNPSMNDWESGDNGIPLGWIVIDAQ